MPNCQSVDWGDIVTFRLGDIAGLIVTSDEIVSARYRSWMMKHSDDALPDDVADIIRNLLTTQPRRRVGTFSGSSANACLRMQELGFLGATGPVAGSQLQEIFNDGKWRHLRWQAILLAAGILDVVEMSLPWQRMRSAGSVDGVGVVPDDHPNQSWRGKEFGFELKGTHPIVFQKLKDTKPKPEHIRQVHRYFLSGGFDLFVVLYENKGTQEISEWVFEPDAAVLAESEREIIDLNDAIDREELHDMLPDCARKTKDAAWQDCPFGKETGICERSGRWPHRKLLGGL